MKKTGQKKNPKKNRQDLVLHPISLPGDDQAASGMFYLADGIYQYRFVVNHKTGEVSVQRIKVAEKDGKQIEKEKM